MSIKEKKLLLLISFFYLKTKIDVG